MPATATVSGRLEIDFSVYDPFAMAFIEDPFPVLERMLNEFPVAFHKDINAWFVSPHELAAEVLRSPRFSTRLADWK
jgi:cytochrome P450